MSEIKLCAHVSSDDLSPATKTLWQSGCYRSRNDCTIASQSFFSVKIAHSILQTSSFLRFFLCNQLAVSYMFLLSRLADTLATFGQHSTLLAMLRDSLAVFVIALLLS